MFSEKSKTSQDFTKVQNKIAQGTKITGSILSEGSLRIEGEVEGKVQAKGKVVLGKTGLINGELICDCADIEGVTYGSIFVHSVLTLKSTAQINGEVVTDKLIVDAGAMFNARCRMKASVKSINDVPQKLQQEEQKALQA